MADAKKITSAVAWNFFGKSTFFFLKFLESLLLVRLIGSEQYGLYGSLINVQAIVALIISLGLESVISRFVPQFRAEQDFSKLHTLMRNVIRMRFLLLAVVGIIFLAGGDELAKIFHGTLTGGYLRLAFALVALVSFHTIFRAYLDLSFQLKFINLLDIGSQSTYLAISFILVSMGYGLPAVVVTLICVNATVLLILYLKYRIEKSKLPGSSGWSGIPKKRVYQYSGTMYILTLLNYVLGKGLDVLLVGILLQDLRQVTYYLLGFNVAFYAVSMTDLAVSGNFVVSLIVEAQTQRNVAALRKIYRGLFEFIYLFIIPILVGGILLNRQIIGLLYRAENFPAAPIMATFLVALSIAKLSSIASTFLVQLDKERTITITRALFGAANLVLDLLLIPKYGAFGAAIATGVILVLVSLYETWLLRGLIAPLFSGKFLAKTLAASAVMGLCVFLLAASWEARAAVKVPVLVAVGGGIYVAGVAFLKPFSPENTDLLRNSNFPLKNLLLRLF